MSQSVGKQQKHPDVRRSLPALAAQPTPGAVLSISPPHVSPVILTTVLYTGCYYRLHFMDR